MSESDGGILQPFGPHLHVRQPFQSLAVIGSLIEHRPEGSNGIVVLLIPSQQPGELDLRTAVARMVGEHPAVSRDGGGEVLELGLGSGQTFEGVRISGIGLEALLVIGDAFGGRRSRRGLRGGGLSPVLGLGGATGTLRTTWISTA